MTELISDVKKHTTFSPSFFLWMTLSMAFFIFSGFGITYLQPMTAGTGQPYPPVVHLHGIFFFSWILLLVVQAFLINIHNVKLHRTLGTFGIVIASGVILMGAMVSILFAGSQIDAPIPDFYNLMYLAVGAVIGFSALFCFAIRNVRTPDSHKRFILYATIILLPPGINRLYMATFGLVDLPVLATYLTMDALVVAILVYDWRTQGTFSKASQIGALVVVMPQLLHPLLASATPFIEFYEFLASLSYYR